MRASTSTPTPTFAAARRSRWDGDGVECDRAMAMIPINGIYEDYHVYGGQDAYAGNRHCCPNFSIALGHGMSGGSAGELKPDSV